LPIVGSAPPGGSALPRQGDMLARQQPDVHRLAAIMLTQRSRYALRALIFIARSAGIAPVPISVIAEDQQLPRKFLEIILLDLKNGGLVESFRGKMGGYRLARPASQISFGEIIRLIEGPLALVPCVSVSAYQRCADCFEESTCVIRKIMLTVRDNTAAILDHTSLADLSIDREAA
jgi:Rrf2 family protein